MNNKLLKIVIICLLFLVATTAISAFDNHPVIASHVDIEIF